MRLPTPVKERLPRRCVRVAHSMAAVAMELATTARVSATIVVVEVLVRRMSLQRLSESLGCRLDLHPTGALREPLDPSELPGSARRQLRCTRRVADAWPFSDGPCLRRALVGGHLVRRLDPSIRLGTAGIGDELLAHAWLEIGGRPLEEVVEYSQFVGPDRHGAP